MMKNQLKWDEKNYKEYIKYLKSLEDKKYKEFNSKLINTKYDMIGIRLPILRSIANEISKGNVLEYLEIIDFKYFEEVMIYGFVLSKCDEKIIDKYLYKYINFIDNWSICDSFSSSFKIVNKKRGKYWIYFNSLINLEEEFYTRIALVMFKNYYLIDDYIDRVLKIVSSIKSNYYYINMASSWLLSEAMNDYSDKVIELLKSGVLNKFVQNKTISKIRDSYRISDEIKGLVKDLRK